jgi:hypothetical protein
MKTKHYGRLIGRVLGCGTALAAAAYATYAGVTWSPRFAAECED